MLKTNFKKTYKKDGDSLYGCQYVVSFCTKYKRNILKEKDFETLRESFNETAARYDFTVLNMEFHRNEIILVVDCDPIFGIQNAVIKLKKESKDALKKADPSFKTRIPCIWTREHFISTVGNVTEKDLKNFKDSQDNYVESIRKNKEKALAREAALRETEKLED